MSITGSGALGVAALKAGQRQYRPAMPVGYEGLTAEFIREPLNFMRQHAMSPPDDFGFQKFSVNSPAATRTGLADLGDRTFGTTNTSTFQDGASRTVTRKDGGMIAWVHVVPHSAPNFPGAATLRALPRLDATGKRLAANQASTKGYLPVHWLPWQSLGIVQYRIPEVPASEVDPSEEEYPRFFFTAGINGCSVFAHGNGASPVIAHAGVSGAVISGSAGDFWRRAVSDTKSAFARARITGEVNSHDYMVKGATPAQVALMKEYEAWLSGNDANRFKVEVVSPFGCIFGVRYGRLWTLYLQKNALTEFVTFHKEAEVNGQGQLKTTGEMTKFEAARSVFEKRKLGPLTIGTKERKVFSTTVTRSLPMQVLEFFPTRSFVANLRESFKRGM